MQSTMLTPKTTTKMSPIKQETATDWEQSKSFLNHQIFQSLPYPTSHFDNQTIIVTGANSGLGLEAARYFVRLGVGKVILAVRSLEKGEAAAKSISESEKRDGIIEVWKLDLASYASVKEFAARASKLERLDVVVANAGVYLYDFMIAEDNESSITVNVISTFLLGLLLIPKLRETSQKQRRPKVFTVTGSFVHYFTKFPEGDAENILEELASKDKAEMPNRYGSLAHFTSTISSYRTNHMTDTMSPKRCSYCSSAHLLSNCPLPPSQAQSSHQSSTLAL